MRRSICIVCHKAYGALSGGRSGHIGGVEWQASILAEWLARNEYDASMLTWDEGGPSVEKLAGVKIIKICRQDSGLKGFRFFHPKWSGLVKAMRLANADVYYHHGAECVTGQIALWCRRNRKKFVFSAASDTDYDKNLPLIGNPRDRLFYRYGLRHADARIAQTEFQQNLLKREFGLDSEVLRYPCPMPSSDKGSGVFRQTSNRVLWIARICKQKRPDRLLDLADIYPEVMFDLVGPFYSDAYSQAIRARAKATANVTIHGAIAREGVASFYEKAACLLCTSDYEGFPNTFLEAWSHALPVISTFDPDSLIKRHKLGIVVSTAQEMRSGIQTLLASPSLFREISQNARRYFLQNHTFEAVLPKYADVFRAVGCEPGSLTLQKGRDLNT